jgi:nicotinate dehydrogenase subunit A
MAETVRLCVNGKDVVVPVSRDERLIDLLRDRLGLNGTRFGCGEEMCGACVVLVDGERAYSCTLPALQAERCRVTTVEGLGTTEEPHALQQAFLELQAGQCGYCLSGIMMSAAALLERTPSPSRADIIDALEQHLCRCGAHNRIVLAIQRAAQLLAEAEA